MRKRRRRRRPCIHFLFYGIIHLSPFGRFFKEGIKIHYVKIIGLYQGFKRRNETRELADAKTNIYFYGACHYYFNRCFCISRLF